MQSIAAVSTAIATQTFWPDTSSSIVFPRAWKWLGHAQVSSAPCEADGWTIGPAGEELRPVCWFLCTQDACQSLCVSGWSRVSDGYSRSAYETQFPAQTLMQQWQNASNACHPHLHDCQPALGGAETWAAVQGPGDARGTKPFSCSALM